MKVRTGIGFLLLASLLVLWAPDRAAATNGWTYDLSSGDTYCGRPDGLCNTARQACESGLNGVYPTLVKMTPIFDSAGIVSDYACYSPHFLSGGEHDYVHVHAWCDEPGYVVDGTVKSGCRKPSTDKNAGDQCNPKSKRAGQPSVADPITLPSGNVFLQNVDFSTADGRLAFVRYYNSQGRRQSDLGFGWRSNYGGKLRFPNASTVEVVHHDGRVFQFALSGSEWLPSDADVTARLANISGNWTLTDNDETVETYDGSGRLISIVERGRYTRSMTYDGSGKLSEVEDSYGRTISLTYTGNRLSTMTDSSSRVYQYHYGPMFDLPNQGSDLLTAIVYPDDTPADPGDNPVLSYLYEDADYPTAITGVVDEKGNRTATWAYNDEGRAIVNERAGGTDRFDLTYNVDGSVTVENPLGKTATYHFTTVAGGPMLSQIQGHASASCVAANADYAYNTSGAVTSATDWNGNETTYVRDSRGLETSRTEAVGETEERTVTTTWDSARRLPTQIVEPRRTIDLTYDTAGRLTEREETDTTSHAVPYSTNGQTRVWGFTYNTTGQLLTIDGPRTDVTDVTTFAYDTDGNLASVTNALSQVTQITDHDARGLPLSVSDPNGAVTEFAYDDRGRLISHSVAGASTSYAYDAAGLVTTMTLPNGTALHYEYDDAHRLTAIENDLGERIEYTLDAAGNITQEVVKSDTAAIVRTLSSTYDELSRILTNVGAASQTTALEYDPNSNLTEITDPRSGVTVQAFDALDRLVQTTDALAGVAGSAYDGRDNLTDVTDQRSLTTSYVYNGFGEVIQRSSPDTGVTVYEYDSAGNVVSMTDARSIETEYSYDALNRVTAVTFPASTGENVAYSYDDATPGAYGIGRLASVSDATGSTAFAYDARGNVVAETRTIGTVVYVTGYAYDLSDNLTSITYPSGRVVSYTRDALGRISSVQTQVDANAPPATLASGIAYLPFGPVTGFTFGNGLTVTYSYDQDYRLTGIDTGGATAVQDLTYSYDAASNITAIVDGLDATRSQDFVYDLLQRLTEADGAYDLIEYGYDPVGNRTSRAVTGTSSISETYSYDTLSNRLLSVSDGVNTRGFSYSAAGNIGLDDRGPDSDVDFIYNHANRLAELKRGGLTEATYAYNAFGEPVIKDSALDGVSYFHYGPAGLLLGTSDGSGGPLEEYVYLDGLPIAQIKPGTGGTTITDITIDNGDAGSSSIGDWTSASAVGGYIGSDYQERLLPEGSPAGGELIDNGSAGFSVTGKWLSSTAVAGFEGSDYLTRDKADNPADFVVDNLDAGFSLVGTWTTEGVTGDWGADYRLVLGFTGTPGDAIVVDNLSTDFSVVGTWATAGSCCYGGDARTHAPVSPYPTGTQIIDNSEPGFEISEIWATSSSVSTKYGADYRTYHPTQPSHLAIIVDNTSADTSRTGTWIAWASAPGYYGSNYEYAHETEPPATFTWTPNIAESGEYKIYARYASNSAFASNATYVIHHAGGSTPVSKDQRFNGGTFWLLGTFTLEPGQNHRVELSNVGAEDAVQADALAFDLVVDNPQRPTWTPSVSVPTEFDVYVTAPAHATYASNAQFEVHHAGGVSATTINQRVSGGLFKKVGRYTFLPGQNHRVELSDEIGNGYLVADAAVFIPTAAPPPSDAAIWTPAIASAGSYRVYARWEAAATRPTDAWYRITHAGGVTDNREWNQTGSGSAWNYLGTYDFAPSSGHKVELFADYNGTVMADAVMLVPEASTGIARATWIHDVEVPGRYEVGGWWREASTRSWMAPFTVTHPGGSVTRRFDQRATLTDWRLLGTYTFLPGEPASVVLENAINDPSDYVIADAIRWRWAGDPGIATWAFTIAQASSHDVYARWVAAPGNAPDAQYTVHHDGGATVVAVDQRHRSGEWVKLGSFAFEAGAYKVELSDQASGLVTADAVYVVPTPAGDPDSYTWTPTIAATADYQVYARWTAGPDRASDAEYVIETPSGLDIVTVSQRQGGGAWNLLGTFALEAGSGNRIVLNAAEADGTVVADAIRIVRSVAAGEIAYVHADHLGQPQKLTDATATLLWDRVALPFGATLSEAGLGETSLRFPGQWADAESGLHYNYFRDYDPSLGRYIQSDPIGLAGGLNTYAYVHGNPLRWTDPTGEITQGQTIILMGVAWALADVAGQLAANCGDWRKTDPLRVVASGLLGANATMLQIGILSRFAPKLLGPMLGITGMGGAAGVALGGGGGAATGLSGLAGRWGGSAGPSLAVSQSFRSFSALKRTLGPAGSNMNWHHIVEQTASNVARFGNTAIHNTTNVVRVEGTVHTQISAFYSSIQPQVTGSTTLTVRQWLSPQSFEAQQAFGQQIMRQFGVF